MPNSNFWELEAWFSPQDFIIAGGGLAGLWTAFELKTKYPSAKITIIERSAIPTGASTRNAGFACFGSPTEMISDALTMGEECMWELVEKRFKGINKTRKVLGEVNIDFDPSGGFECYKSDIHNIPDLEEKVADLNKNFKQITGLENSFEWCSYKLTRQGLTGFDAMVQNRLEGGLHSGKLIEALMNLVRKMGVIILSGIEVKYWEIEADRILVHTSTNPIKTGKLILATNAFQLPHSSIAIKPARGQIILSEPIPDLKLKGTFHFDEGFYYFRNAGNRVLLGGARNKDFAREHTTELNTTSMIQEELERFMSEYILPGKTFKIDQRWSGIMAFTSDKKPAIKEIEPNVHAIISCNGMGVALSPIMAEELVSQL